MTPASAWILVAALAVPFASGQSSNPDTRMTLVSDVVIPIGEEGKQVRLVWVEESRALPKAGEDDELDSSHPPDNRFEVRLVPGEGRAELVIARLVTTPLHRRSSDRIVELSAALHWDEDSSTLFVVAGQSVGEGIHLAIYEVQLQTDDDGLTKAVCDAVKPIAHTALSGSRLEQAGLLPRVQAMDGKEDELRVWLEKRIDDEQRTDMVPVVFQTEDRTFKPIEAPEGD